MRFHDEKGVYPTRYHSVAHGDRGMTAMWKIA